jgi:hypothetical protein
LNFWGIKKYRDKITAKKIRKSIELKIIVSGHFTIIPGKSQMQVTKGRNSIFGIF